VSLELQFPGVTAVQAYLTNRSTILPRAPALPGATCLRHFTMSVMAESSFDVSDGGGLFLRALRSPFWRSPATTTRCGLVSRAQIRESEGLTGDAVVVGALHQETLAVRHQDNDSCGKVCPRVSLPLLYRLPNWNNGRMERPSGEKRVR
jgi:hypothetical protein